MTTRKKGITSLVGRRKSQRKQVSLETLAEQMIARTKVASLDERRDLKKLDKRLAEHVKRVKLRSLASDPALAKKVAWALVAETEAAYAFKLAQVRPVLIRLVKQLFVVQAVSGEESKPNWPLALAQALKCPDFAGEFAEEINDLALKLPDEYERLKDLGITLKDM